MRMLDRSQISVYPILSNFSGFDQLAKLAEQLDPYEFSEIVLDMQQMTWCDGNMCSPLGALLYKAGRNINELTLVNIPTRVETILCKNGFLTNYGRMRKEDVYGSTIQYQRFEPDEDRAFSLYLEDQLRNKAIPDMSPALRKRFFEGLLEIYNNAVTHSETLQGIFACGQYFHQQQRLDFTITDLGVGIRQNLIKKIGLELPAEKAIDWAVEGNNTTKQGQIPGGLGLKLLREFIGRNQGRLQIVSDQGYWEQQGDQTIESRSMRYLFPGTVVNLEINTADNASYMLSSERPPANPF